MFTASVSAGDLWLPAIFSDHMVLQSGVKIPVWGKAEPGAGVSVILGDQVRPTAADRGGNWRVFFNTAASGAAPLTLTVSADTGDSITVSDILVGEVWLASGQSNMELALKDAIGFDAEKSLPPNPRLRHYRVNNSANPLPVTETGGQWTVASPLTVGGWSAAGYFFAKKLQRELNTPVGIVHSSWGASALEAWVSAESLDSVDFLKTARERFEKLERENPGRKPPAKWDMSVPLTAQPLTPQKKPAWLFNGMIRPLAPFALRGVIWYQGEGNASRAAQYRAVFPLLIADWRKQWGAELPFYFCQLANFHAPPQSPADAGEWPELREAQALTLGVPRTGMAVLIDVGEADDIHPRNKRAVGERLAALALANDYGKKIPAQGPAYAGMSVEGNQLRVRFTHADGGLRAKPLPATYDTRTLKNLTAPLAPPRPGSPVQGFIISGADGVWHWADAKIDGDSVIVSAPEVPAPVAARYAWADNPVCNLCNGAGFPAAPFRTDDAPLTMTKEY